MRTNKLIVGIWLRRFGKRKVSVSELRVRGSGMHSILMGMGHWILFRPKPGNPQPRCGLPLVKPGKRNAASINVRDSWSYQ